jgi:hypothetical protein
MSIPMFKNVTVRTIEITRTLIAPLLLLSNLAAHSVAMDHVRVSADRRGFVLEPSGRSFVPRGFNYDHDESGRLIEDYWESEWSKVEEDFREMKALGANVVRVHLQFGKFFKVRERPNAQALDRLQQLLRLSERLGLYLDVTGLGCYHKKDVPSWYDDLTESERWSAQARFWEVVAEHCAPSPAIFCYDLMNEPVVPGGKRSRHDWLGPAFGGKHFVQLVTLDQADRPRPEIARQWIHRLRDAIRERDRSHLITVGLVDWSLDRPGLTSGFIPQTVANELDFVCVHTYPEKDKVDAALDTLRGFAVGKPVLIEETFPLKCSILEFRRFFEGSKAVAAGWIGFYWGKTPDECRRSGTIADAITADWLNFFADEIAKAP